VVTQELVADAIEFIGGHTGFNVSGYFVEGTSSDRSGNAHSLNGLCIFDLWAVIGRRALASHVLWDFDGVGDNPYGGDHTWL
jgi:hypothetical protein